MKSISSVACTGSYYVGVTFREAKIQNLLTTIVHAIEYVRLCLARSHKLMAVLETTEYGDETLGTSPS
jgi:hypothetical protein